MPSRLSCLPRGRHSNTWRCTVFIFLLLYLLYFACVSDAAYYSPFQFSDDEREERILAALEKVDLGDLGVSTQEEEELSDSYEAFSFGLERPPVTKRRGNGKGKKPPTSGVRKEKPKPSPNEKKSRREAAAVSSNKVAEDRASQNSIPPGYLARATTPSTITPVPSTPQTAPRSPTHLDWVRHFIAQCHRDVLLPVPIDFIVDNFNLAHLAPLIEDVGQQAEEGERRSSLDNLTPNSQLAEETAAVNKGSGSSAFPIYRQALRLLVEGTTNGTDIPDSVERAARALYLMIHQRYVLSPRGLDTVRRRFLLAKQTSGGPRSGDIDPIFGRCPRLACRGTPLLPYGDSDVCSFGDLDGQPTDPGTSWNSKAKRYCCSCRRVWYHWDSQVDGCAWGPSFCHLFLMTCGEEVFGDELQRLGRYKAARDESIDGDEIPIPRIFGFRLHPKASTSWNP